MGQKINPLGFRLGTTQSHHSLWFAKPKNYSKGIQEDQKIRDFIKNYVQKNMKIVEKNMKRKNLKIPSSTGGLAHIEIKKKFDVIQVIIFMGFPTLLIESNPEGIGELYMNLQKEFDFVSRKLNLTLTRITKPYRNPTILAEFIAEQLKNRVSFRKAMKKAIELANQADIKGIQIQISGRIGGNEIARVERIKEGRLPRQTIQAKIDYCSYPIQTINGILGIKIWIFIDKKEE